MIPWSAIPVGGLIGIAFAYASHVWHRVWSAKEIASPPEEPDPLIEAQKQHTDELREWDQLFQKETGKYIWRDGSVRDTKELIDPDGRSSHIITGAYSTLFAPGLSSLFTQKQLSDEERFQQQMMQQSMMQNISQYNQQSALLNQQLGKTPKDEQH